MATPSVRKAVIPAAGMGSRLLPCTKSQPKEMLAVGRLPTIQHVLEELVAADVGNICIVTGWQKRAIEDHFDLSHGGLSQLKGDPKELGVLADPELNRRLFYVRQAAQRGLGDAVLHARHFVGPDSFLVALGDTILYSPDEPHLIQRLIDSHCQGDVFATIAVEEVRREDVHRYGIVAPAGEMTGSGAMPIVDIVEKPSADEAPSRYAVASRYIFEPIIFDAIDRTPPGKNGEIQLTDAIKLLIHEGHRCQVVPLAGRDKRYDIGNFGSYFRAFIDMALRDDEEGDALAEYLRSALDTLT